MKSYTVKGYKVKIGKNSTENWVLLDNAKNKHWFFHLSSFPSCYLIWECEESKVSNDILYELASLCHSHTKYKHVKNIKVDCTPCNNVKKGQEVGEVYYVSKKKVITVKL